jgi:thioredoxin reductase
MQTDVPGIFAAGDVNDGEEKQIIVAAGEGCVALLNAVRYLQKLK